MSLKKYKEKRDFTTTQEPAPKKTLSKKPKSEKKPIFVIHKHAASHLHYDLRLEEKGVLKSWAVPKGPSKDPSVKRLAVEVEDHPLAYAEFEGTIPKGQYGAGTVEIWDQGTWECVGSYSAAYKKGHIVALLHGKKLKGLWNLVRLKSKESDTKKNWLFIKMKDENKSG